MHKFLVRVTVDRDRHGAGRKDAFRACAGWGAPERPEAPGEEPMPASPFCASGRNPRVALSRALQGWAKHAGRRRGAFAGA